MWAGIPIIDCKYPNRPGTNDKFFYLRDLATAFGYTTIKLELSVAYASKYNQTPWGTPGSLAELLAESSMDAVIGDASIERVQFSAFSLAHDENNPWNYHWYKSVADTIETEFYDACVYLRDQYDGTGKEFIMANWEGDWQLLNDLNRLKPVPVVRLGSYADWHRRRLRALRQAMADTAGSDVTLRYGLEMNRVRDRYSLRLVTDIMPKLTLDPADCLISLSHYEAIEGWNEGITVTADLQADIETKMQDVFDRVRAYAPAGLPIIIGEYAWPALAPYFPGSLDMIALHGTVYNKAAALGCEGIFFWQLCDNEQYPSTTDPLGFCLYNRDGDNATVGSLTDAGTFWA